MSRSKKKTPKAGITSADSEKANKRKANRKFRRLTKAKIKKGDTAPSSMNEVSNVWAFDKDGKRYLKEPKAKDLRK